MGGLLRGWLIGGALLESTNVAGPWTTNAAAAPFSLAPKQPQKYYRVIVQ